MGIAGGDQEFPPAILLALADLTTLHVFQTARARPSPSSQLPRPLLWCDTARADDE